jgi:acetyl-CoA C-acetyltransferase
MMNKETAQELGLTWLAEIGAHGVVAGPDSTLRSQPANAITKALGREGITVDQLDVVEINEAFAAVALASTHELGVNPEIVNVNGGAIAVGHPIGMSGARITLRVAVELARRGSGYGVAALCGAGGQGDAWILRAGSARALPAALLARSPVRGGCDFVIRADHGRFGPRFRAGLAHPAERNDHRVDR